MELCKRTEINVLSLCDVQKGHQGAPQRRPYVIVLYSVHVQYTMNLFFYMNTKGPSNILHVR